MLTFQQTGASDFQCVAPIGCYRLCGQCYGHSLNNALKVLFGIALISTPESILNLTVC